MRCTKKTYIKTELPTSKYYIMRAHIIKWCHEFHYERLKYQPCEPWGLRIESGFTLNCDDKSLWISISCGYNIIQLHGCVSILYLASNMGVHCLGKHKDLTLVQILNNDGMNSRNIVNLLVIFVSMLVWIVFIVNNTRINDDSCG